jgi:chromosome segregation ATPase
LGWCWKINGEETTHAVQILGDKSAEMVINEKFEELKEKIDSIEFLENIEALKSYMDDRFLELDETINTKFNDNIKQTDEKIVELTKSFQNQIDELKEYDDNLNASKIYLSPCTELGPDGLTSEHSIQYTLENIYSYIEKYESKISELESKISELENTINKNHPEDSTEDTEEGIEVVNEDEI